MKTFYQNWKLDQELPMVIHQSIDLSFYPHFHAEVEFVYVESGSILVGANEDKRLLKQGDMAIFGSNDIHYFDSKDLASNMIVVIFHPELVGKSVSWPGDFRFESPFIPADQPGLQTVKAILNRILREKKEAKPGHRLLIQASLLELCAIMQRHLPVHALERESQERIATRKIRIQRILSFIEEHYQEDLSVEAMCVQFGMEPSYFCRMFKKSIGMNFRTYLNTIRVLNATRRLEISDASITDIALDCGFGSVRTFNRVYRELQGCPPSEVRRRKN
ncbi:AraC family transcriptional regulator [Paenibacillus vini]|uniref:AraC family transcriptional regulator n=1 Tax=Paenibacillus vini TaxID=1476024 RepID=A0ABQ4MHC7_9BACL|nr:AraC family transcriptional regulator [Paenibacillus vini]MDN4070129.1 AraC family transcriptional regulator [Paenibacillus vini]GIP55398.1 AraC family transcriptional regulator [Paenibacillus vini]